MKTPLELAQEYARRNRYSLETKQEDIVDIFYNGYLAGLQARQTDIQLLEQQLQNAYNSIMLLEAKIHE